MIGRGVAVTTLVMALVPPVLAGGQYEVQDAALVERGACEFELWHVDVRKGGHGTWLAPTCGLAGQQQISVTAGQEHEGGERNAVAGVEWMLVPRSVDEHDLGYGLRLGAEYREESGRVAEFHALFPVSLRLSHAGVMVHGNLGFSHDRDARRRSAMTWGVAGDFPVGFNTTLVAEMSGNSRSGEHPLLQVGPSMALVDGHVVVDLTYGRVLGGDRDEHWAVGFSLAF